MKTLIIGAGPAGLNCAINAASDNNEVIIIEKNEKAGKKLFITGKGRCNVTNDCSNEDFIHNVVSNSRFLYSSINCFSTKDTINYFENNKCPIVVERGNRVFPKSNHSYDITNTLVHSCIVSGADIHLNETVLSIVKTNNIFEVTTDKRNYFVDNVVIATGGLAYPATGSTGDGYSFAQSFSHSIVTPVPALCGLKIKEHIPNSLIGFTLKNVSLTAIENKHKITEFGELTFQDDYLDGPISLSLSSQINRKNPSDIKLEIDFKPSLNEEKLLARIQREVGDNPRSDVYSLLKGLFPSEMINFFIGTSGIDPYEKLATFSNKKRIEMVHYIKHFSFTFNGVNPFERAIITSGGINTNEISSKTMESKFVDGLFFAGEIIDVDAYTGGFNIQIALSTGALAGKTIKNRSLGLKI